MGHLKESDENQALPPNEFPDIWATMEKRCL